MNDSISDNEYFLKYGLERDPFPLDVIDKNIFLTPEINRRLKQAKQHILSSQNILLITSAPGAGKSLLAQKLIILKEENWRTSIICVQPDTEPESLAHSVIQQLLPDKHEDISQSISMLHKFLEQSYLEEIVPVIVIDDVHKLSFKTLQFVLQLADLRYNDAFFRFVLFANESINESISKPGLKELAEGVVEILSMPCFSQEQIPSYLSYRFSSCGEGVELPFSESELGYLHKASAGLPGGINILARQLMQQALIKGETGKNHSGMAMALSLLLLAIAGYLYYENRTLVDVQAALAEEIQARKEETVIKESALAVVENVEAIVEEKTSDRNKLPTLDDSLSLKLSDMLIMRSAGKTEATDSP
jgi:type II secretory pathway predicted ATPase ExeA